MPSERLGTDLGQPVVAVDRGDGSQGSSRSPSRISRRTPPSRLGLLHTTAPVGGSPLLLLIATDSPPRARAWVGAHDFGRAARCRPRCATSIHRKGDSKRPERGSWVGRRARGHRSIAVARATVADHHGGRSRHPERAADRTVLLRDGRKGALCIFSSRTSARATIAGCDPCETLVNALGGLLPEAKPLGAWGTPWIDPLWGNTRGLYRDFAPADQKAREGSPLDAPRCGFSTLPDVAVLAAPARRSWSEHDRCRATGPWTARGRRGGVGRQGRTLWARLGTCGGGARWARRGTPPAVP